MPSENTILPALPSVLRHWSDLPAALEEPAQTTIDLTSREGRVMLQNVLAGESKKLWDANLPMPLNILDVVCHYGEREDDETGELTGGRIVTLSCQEGMFYTMSRWAFYDLQRAAIADNWPARGGPLTVNAIRARCANGHTRLAFQLV